MSKKKIGVFEFILDFMYLKIMRFRLKNKDFSIICDDCWGGKVYLDLGISYASPTVNIFIYSSCYIKLVKDLKAYMDKELVFVEKSRYERSNFGREKSGNKYPIGILDDIEIHFLHSKDQEDAQSKWDLRKKRINYDRLLFKFSDSFLNDPQDLISFEELPIKNKIIFVSKKYEGLNNYILLDEFKEQGFVSDPFKYRWIYRKHFDFVKWLNSFN